jgi:hypothetical protein
LPRTSVGSAIKDIYRVAAKWDLDGGELLDVLNCIVLAEIHDAPSKLVRQWCVLMDKIDAALEAQYEQEQEENP